MGKLTPQQQLVLGPTFRTEPGPAAVPENTDSASRSVFGTAMELENPVYNLVDYLSSPTFELDPTFTTEEYMERANAFPAYEEYKNEFIGVKSGEEFDFVAAQITDEIEKRQFLASKGWTGVAAAIGAGLLSPTVLLPLVGQARGVLAIGQGAGYGLLAAGLDEAALQLNRPGREASDTAIAVGASTILGGLLGGLVGNLGRGRYPSIQADMAGQPGEVYVQSSVPTGPTGSSVGAMEAVKDPGPLRSALGAEKLFKWFGPVMRGMEQNITDVSGSVTQRNFVAQLGDGGLTTRLQDRGISPTEGLGTIENRITTYDVHEWKLDEALNDAYGSYMETGRSPLRIRENFARARAGNDKLTFEEFGHEFTRAMFRGGESEIPEIAKAARQFASDSMETIYKAALDAGVLDEFDEAARTDPGYWMRNWDAVAVSNKLDPQGRTFVEKLSADFERQLLARFNTMAEQLNTTTRRADETIADLSQTLEESQQTQKLVQAELETLRKQNADQLAVAEELKDLRAALKAADEAEAPALRSRIEALQTEDFRLFRRSEAKLTRRIARLRKAGTDAGAKQLDEVKARQAARVSRFNERVRAMGADSYDTDAMTAEFSAYARQIAEETQGKIMASGPRMAQFNAIVGKRGSEIARALNVNSLDYQDFIEMNPMASLRRYIRTMAPDIELANRFGDPGVSKYIDDLEQERIVKAQNIEAKAWDKSRKEKALRKLNAQYETFARDAEVMIERLRHVRGLPDNPNAYLERAGRVALGLNTLRFMGSVVPSSLADVGRIIFKHGFGNTFRYAIAPVLTDMKSWKLSAREAKYAGNALDALNHRRALALTDMFEDFHRRSKFERAVEIGASRIGMVAGFDFWTSGMKMLDTSIVNGRIMDAIARLDAARTASGGLKQTKQVKRDQRFLAGLGLDQGMAERIWRQMDGLDAGGGRSDAGTWLPNTESWTDEQAKIAYRAAINRSADTTITTPGIERPSLVDSSTAARLVFQFKSFVFSSTTRTLLSGLQQRDAAAVQGVITSLMMGAFSYYVYLASRGEADQFDPVKNYDKIMDEAIDRSGLTGVLSLGQQLLQRIPATAPYTSFSSERTTRRASSDLIDLLAGPSYNMAKTVGNVMVGLDEPTESTLHQARLLAPYQNVFWLRLILDKLEAGIADAANLPENRR